MDLRFLPMKSSGNSDAGSEAPPERTSPLPPPSPTGYEHCFLARCNPDGNSKSAQFTVQAISYVPTGPQSLPLNALALSALTQPQRDVLHYILEDRNSKTGEEGRWVLVALLGSGASDDERSEDFEISIMFCEYGASADSRFEHNKQFYLTMATDGLKDNMCTEDLRENKKDREKEEMPGVKKDKGKQVVGREYAAVGQGWNSSPLPSDKHGFRGAPEDSKVWGTIPSQTEDQGLRVTDVQVEDSGQHTEPSANMRPSKWVGTGFGGWDVPKSEPFSLSNAPQMTDEAAKMSAPSPSLATIQAAISQWEASSVTSENRATPSVLSDAKEPNSSQGTEKTRAARLPTLTSSQLANTQNWANNLRNAGDFRQAIVLYRIVWYCRQFLNGPHHPQTKSTIQQLAGTYDINNQIGMAAKVREALIPRNTTSPADGLAPVPADSDLLEIQQWAVELRRQGVLNRAIWLFTIVWYARDKVGGESNGNSRTTMVELALAYEANSQPHMAKRLRDEVAERRRKQRLGG